jgi:hypothetical protein
MLRTSVQKNVAVADTETCIVEMTFAKKVAYVKEKLSKLKPKKRDGVVRSIFSIFQFKGEIEEPEIQKVIRKLQSDKYLAIDKNDKVQYKEA